MTKKINELQKEIETLLTKSKDDIQFVMVQLKNKQEEMNTLQAQLEKAEKDINISEYEKVSKELWVIKQTVKMLETKVQKLKTEPIITKEQMREYEREINKSTQEQMKSARALFKKIEDELKKAVLMDLDARVTGGQLLDKVERDLVKNNREHFKDEKGNYLSSLHLNIGNTTLDYEVKEFMMNVLKNKK
ncbi:hypothetical protein ACWOA5_08000 [Granulicatella adiacens]